MKKTFFIFLFFALITITVTTCNDPIFFIVHAQSEQLSPLIGGSPTNFVEFNGIMYVASGKKIFLYKGGWGVIPQNKWVTQLAATDNFLYVLYHDGSVVRFNSSLSPSSSGVSYAKSIFAVNDVLFVGSEIEGFCTIHYLDDNNNIVKIVANSRAILNGVAYDGTDYYLCTNGGGIYISDLSSDEEAEPIVQSSYLFTGIISLKDNTIVGITRNGNLYQISSSGVVFLSAFNDGRLSSGALALWTNGTDNLLLAGRQDNLTYSIDSGYTYGYMELLLNESGGISVASAFCEPGVTSPSTVSSNESYMSSIGKNPVNHIFHASDGTLFASTQKNGVWSYKYRNGEYQWNAEIGF